MTRTSTPAAETAETAWWTPRRALAVSVVVTGLVILWQLPHAADLLREVDDETSYAFVYPAVALAAALYWLELERHQAVRLDADLFISEVAPRLRPVDVVLVSATVGAVWRAAFPWMPYWGNLAGIVASLLVGGALLARTSLSTLRWSSTNNEARITDSRGRLRFVAPYASTSLSMDGLGRVVCTADGRSVVLGRRAGKWKEFDAYSTMLRFSSSDAESHAAWRGAWFRSNRSAGLAVLLSVAASLSPMLFVGLVFPAARSLGLMFLLLFPVVVGLLPALSLCNWLFVKRSERSLSRAMQNWRNHTGDARPGAWVVDPVRLHALRRRRALLTAGLVVTGLASGLVGITTFEGFNATAPWATLALAALVVRQLSVESTRVAQESCLAAARFSVSDGCARIEHPAAFHIRELDELEVEVHQAPAPFLVFQGRRWDPLEAPGWDAEWTELAEHLKLSRVAPYRRGQH